ncbi:MAG: hypothetical protein WCV67_13650 [Victivallaceae bacterium]|jgi:hypothetical protein
MSRKDYISDGLIHIRDRLKTYEKGNDHDTSTLPQISDEQIAQTERGETVKSTEPDRKFIRAMRKRHDEYLKSRKDLHNKIIETMAVLPEEQKKFKFYEEETAGLHELCQKMSVEINELAEKDGQSENDTALLADACRKIENSRLEFIRQTARYKKLMPHEGHSGGGSSKSSLLPDINSMTFLQIFRLGFVFSLPAAIAIFLGALIISAVIYFSMGAGGS